MLPIDRIQRYIDETKKSSNNDNIITEIEVRFGTFKIIDRKTRFVPGISKEDYLRLFNYYKDKYYDKLTLTTSTDTYYSSDYRKTVISSITGCTDRRSSERSHPFHDRLPAHLSVCKSRRSMMGRAKADQTSCG